MAGISTDIWLFGLLLAATVGAISVFDFRDQIISNALNGILACAGIGFQIIRQPEFLPQVLIGSLLVLLCFLAVRTYYFRSRGIAGLGLGDVKMAGASAVWINPFNLPVFLFLASGTALVSLPVFRRYDAHFRASGRIPFGPFLGIGLISTWSLETFLDFNLTAL